jgi:hypothetical protein
MTRCHLALAAALFATGCIANPATAVDDDPDAAGVSDAGLVPGEDLDDDAGAANPGRGPETDAPPPPVAPDAPDAAPPSPGCSRDPFIVDQPESATRIGDALYIALEDGRFLRAPLGEGTVGWPEDVPELAGVHDDRGLARLQRVAEGMYARRVQRGDVGRVELLTVVGDGGLTLRSTTVVPGTSDAMAVWQSHVFVCSGEATVAVSGATGAVIEVPGGACDAADAHEGGGRYLGRIRHGHGNLVPSYAVFEMSVEGARGLMDHGFNPGGSHHYGDVVALFLGERRGLVDVQNAHNFFGLDLTGETGGHIYDTRLSLGADAAVISTAGDLVWVATNRQILTYDLETPAALAEGLPSFPDSVDAALREARHEVPRVLHADDDIAVVRGADGRLAVWDLRDGAPWPLQVEACP